SEGCLKLWSDDRILAGTDWAPRISENLESARLVLVLLSPDYLASAPCGRELARSLELRASRGAQLVPIGLKPCDWQRTPLGRIQAGWGRSGEPPPADLPPREPRRPAAQRIDT